MPAAAGRATGITITRSYDYELIRRIMTDPQVYDGARDDHAPARDKFFPQENDLILYLLASKDNDTFGLFVVAPQTLTCWEIHTRMLPRAWGKYSVDAGKAVIQWIFQNTVCERLVSNVPAFHRAGLIYSLKCGLTPFGLNPRSFRKDGKLHDQTLVGISKEAVCL